MSLEIPQDDTIRPIPELKDTLDSSNLNSTFNAGHKYSTDLNTFESKVHILGSVTRAVKNVFNQFILLRSSQTRSLFNAIRSYENNKSPENLTKLQLKIASWKERHTERNTKSQLLEVVNSLEDYLSTNSSQQVSPNGIDEPAEQILNAPEESYTNPTQKSIVTLKGKIEEIKAMNFQESSEAISNARESIKLILHDAKHDTTIDGKPVIEHLQELNSQLMDLYFKKLTEFAFAQMKGKIPDEFKFTCIVLGSGATRATSPFSDYDFALIYERAEDAKLAEKLVTLMHKYNDPKLYRLCDQMTPKGPFLGKYLIGTPADIQKMYQQHEKKPNEALSDVIKEFNTTAPISGNSPTLYANFKSIVDANKPKNTVEKLYANALEFQNEVGGDSFDVKRAFLRAPKFYIDAMFLEYIQSERIEPNEETIWSKLEILKDNGVMQEEEYQNIRDLLVLGYNIRYLSHFKAQEELDSVMTVTPKENFKYFQDNYLILDNLNDNINTFKTGDIGILLTRAFSTLNSIVINSKIKIAGDIP